MSDTKYLNNRIQFTMITNPFNLVKDPDLISNSEVYETRYEKSTEAIQHSFLVKENKKGTPLRVDTTEVLRPMEKDFKSMVGIFYKYKMFPIIECGKSSMRRDLITVDIDENLTNEVFFGKLKEIENLPECVCTKHKSTGHWQIQFYLKDCLFIKEIGFEKNNNGKYVPFIKRDDTVYNFYVKTVKRFAKYFKGIFKGTDIYYQGVLCRNPYSFSQESYLFFKNRFVSLHEKRPFGNFIADYVEFLDKNKVILRKNTNFDVKDINEKNPELSRHKLTMVYAREWIWNNMKNGNVPDESDLEEFLLNNKFEIADKCMKEPHSDKEIKSQVHSLYQWSVNNYREIDKTNGQWKSSICWNKNQRTAKIKKAKKLKKVFLNYLTEGLSLTEIAKRFNMSRVTLYSYMAIFFVIDMVKTVVTFGNSKMKYLKLWDEIICEISDRIKEMKLKYGNSKIKWKHMNYVSELSKSEICDTNRFYAA